MKFINKYSSLINIAFIVTLIVSLNLLPRKITKAIEEGLESKYGTDTVEVEKIVAAPLNTKGNFIYFDGIIEGHTFQLKKTFSYDTRYPEEVYEGYLSVARANNGGKYYIWTPSDVSYFKGERLKGYFFTDNLCKFQSVAYKDEYHDILYPIIKKMNLVPDTVVIK